MLRRCKRFLLVLLAPPIIGVVLHAIGATWRRRVHGRQHLAALRRLGQPVLALCLHSRINALVYALGRPPLRPWGVMVSQSVDGRVIARVARHFGFGVIHGSARRGGPRALVEAVRALRSGAFGLGFGIMIDGGGRGPRGRCKPGAALLAARAGAWVLPVACSAERAWIAPSWDRSAVPEPFTRLHVRFGRPFRLPSDTSGAAFERSRQRIEDAVLANQSILDRQVGHPDHEALRV